MFSKKADILFKTQLNVEQISKNINLLFLPMANVILSVKYLISLHLQEKYIL